MLCTLIMIAFLVSFLLIFRRACICFFFFLTRLCDHCWRSCGTRRRLCSCRFGLTTRLRQSLIFSGALQLFQFSPQHLRQIGLLAGFDCLLTLYHMFFHHFLPVASPTLWCSQSRQGSFILDNFSFSRIHSSSRISLVFVFLRVRSLRFLVSHYSFGIHAVCVESM